MRSSGFLWVLVAILLVMDFYVFLVLRQVSQSLHPKLRVLLLGLYWVVAILAVLVILFFPSLRAEEWPKALRTYLLAIVVGLFFAKLVSTFFFALDDLRRGATWVTGKLVRGSAGKQAGAQDITRSAFLSWLGLAAGSTLFGSLVYGFSNKYNYNVKKIRLSFDNLPAAFRGIKLLHISDIHAGSFTDQAAVRKGIEKIMEQQADIILFTGDLVNDRADEMRDFRELFAGLSAPMGVYSVLGNHDYGDYYQWESDSHKKANLESLKKLHGEMGWRLLMNEHVVLEKEGGQIALLGIENWSAKGNFPKYGSLPKAYAGTEAYPFRILMSHDPSHWEGEVLPGYGDIDLMLSGHTHGMQFGVELPGFKWSPVQYMYRQWAGLYEQGKQRLYVNRGFGFIGYPGRVGILPEITVLELA